MRVKHIMNREVIVGRPEMLVEEANELMQQHHISGLPVVDEEGSVLGVFSQTDALIKAGQCIGDSMTSPAVTLDQEAGIKEAAALMAAKDINRLPVLRQGRLVGLVSRADIVRYVATHHAWVEPRAEDSCPLDT
ncbi:MAG: CBS domain-containing protein [Chloroflexi bacterium]|nr:CBS domain-containing protein [Chloroflexota bacterium]